jgi:hypothetical protein
MKKTILAATIAFWCVMIGAVIAGNVAPPAALPASAPATPPAAPSAAVPVVPPPERLAQAPAAKGTAPIRRGYTLQDVAQHAAPKDCWMAIHGKVYDFSAYIPQHPSAPEVMTRHCGKEATRAFDTKDRGRPHGDYAKGLLAKYEVGVLRD